MDKRVKATVDWCNEIRTGKGLDPIEDLPTGIMGDMGSCPCGKATGIDVGTWYYYPKGFNRTHVGSKGIDLPLLVRDFVHMFDKGLYPKYVERT